MLEKFNQHITTNFPFLIKSKLLLAISGGIDSVVLAHILYKLQFNFSLAHCNFKLRYEDSDKDAVFVRNLASKLEVPYHGIEFDTATYANTKGFSTQMAARELRYNWFDELVQQHQYDYILTAHHANDNIETVLINLTRGSSLNGLVGIPEINKNIVRPLLPFTRDEIEHFTITNEITWREDESNQSTKYFRNKIRHNVIPVLESLNKNLLHTFTEHLSYLKKEQKVLTQHLEFVKNEVCIFGKPMKIDITKLQQYDEVSVYLHYILNEYNFTEWDNVVDLCNAQSGKYILSNTHRLSKDRDFLILEAKKTNLHEVKYELTKGQKKISTPISLSFSEVTQTAPTLANVIYIDANAVEYPLYIRKKKEGDYFFPFGMKGKKKLSKYFKDEKLSLPEKENCWLLCDANNTIIWVIGMRADARFSVSKTTQKIIKITQEK